MATAMASIVLAAVLGGLGRLALGPTPVDRWLSIQLLGTGGAAAMLLLGFAYGSEGFADAALIIALLTSVAVGVLARGRGQTTGSHE